VLKHSLLFRLLFSHRFQEGILVSSQSRRSFVLSAGAVAASMIGRAEQAPAAQAKAAEPPIDPVAQLNLQFRALYGVNRQELLAANPLAALTLIGTGEIWRVEFGQAVKSYPPTRWIANVKGVMHGVIATQATWARLVRGKSVNAAREAAVALATGLSDAHKNAATDLPAEVAPPARVVLEALREMSARWAGGKPAGAEEFPATFKRVRPDLDKVLNATGEAIFDSIVRNLQAFARESKPQDWDQALVGVCGVGFARRDNIEIAAAMSVMGRDSVGTRLLYLENAFTIPAGITQLAAAIADRELGQAVFGDPYRMWRDLLGGVATRHAGGGFFPEMGKPG
jgi:hypothetical protein